MDQLFKEIQSIPNLPEAQRAIAERFLGQDQQGSTEFSTFLRQYIWPPTDAAFPSLGTVTAVTCSNRGCAGAASKRVEDTVDFLRLHCTSSDSRALSDYLHATVQTNRCGTCREDSTHFEQITSLPPVFKIHINRQTFKAGKPVLHRGPIVLPWGEFSWPYPVRGKVNSLFQIKAILCHRGMSPTGNSGHWVTYVRETPDNTVFTSYNDSVRETGVPAGIINTSTVCWLFVQRANDQDNAELGAVAQVTGEEDKDEKKGNEGMEKAKEGEKIKKHELATAENTGDADNAIDVDEPREDIDDTMSTGSDITSITREAFEVAANDPLRVNPPEVNDAGVNDAEVDDARRRGFIEIERDDRDHTMPSRLARWQMHMALDDGNPPKIIPSSESWLQCTKEGFPGDYRELVTNDMITTAYEAITPAASPQNLGGPKQARLPGWIAGLFDESLGQIILGDR
ncbi:hypothetical protein HBH53_061720 [Parastagonospora nodorum]|nr:hypothetical protein HBH53_061720 [Parastagonospora nodorum]